MMPSVLVRAAAVTLAATTGVAVFLAYPDWNHHYLAWFAYVPLLIAASGTTPRQGFWLGLLAGTITNLGGFHWITEMLGEFGHMSALPAWAILSVQAVTQGLSVAIGLFAWRWLVARGAPVAVSAFLCLWLGEAVTPMLFPWFLGNAITPELQMIQIAELGGVHLVSAMLYAANAALTEPFLALLQRRRPAWRFLVVTAAGVALAAGWGALRIPQVDAAQKAAPKMKIGMVEGDIGIWEKEARYLSGPARSQTLRHNLLKHQQMTRSLEAKGAELVVWPESAYQPFSDNPVLHTTDHFLLVGAGGAILRHDGTKLTSEPPDRLGLPRDLGLLSALSSPRGDLWRAIDGGRRVVTVTPEGAWRVDLPQGETGVATVSPNVDGDGKLAPGLVVSRSGRVWKLDFEVPAAPVTDKGAPVQVPGQGAPRPQLLPVAHAGSAGPVDVTSAARNSLGTVVLVGRSGALLKVQGDLLVRMPAPALADLWSVSGDPRDVTFLAAGDGGTVVMGEGDRWFAQRVGVETFYATWFGPDGSMYVAGKHGAWYTRTPRGKWQTPTRAADVDLLAGATDAEGRVLLVGRGGRVFLTDDNGVPREVNAGSRGEITAAVGFQAQPAWVLPRNVKRILPADRPLPDAALTFPADVQADLSQGLQQSSSPIRGFHVPLLFGAMTQGGRPEHSDSTCTECNYNSALLLDGKGNVLGMHDKAFLLMFGEYLPFGERFPWLYDLSPETSRFQPGTRTAPLELGKARMGMLICYEDLVPRYARRIAAHNPNVFVNLTNDAWFGKTEEPYHHLNLALMRTVEYRRWLLRSTNTGVSVFIDAVGLRVAETSLDGAETLLQDVPLLEDRTVYASMGDWPLLVLAAWLLLLWGRALRGPGPAGRAKKTAKPRKTAPKKKSASPEAPEIMEPAKLK